MRQKSTVLFILIIEGHKSSNMCVVSCLGFFFPKKQIYGTLTLMGDYFPIVYSIKAPLFPPLNLIYMDWQFRQCISWRQKSVNHSQCFQKLEEIKVLHNANQEGKMFALSHCRCN